ncbi:MAG: hypothetical protein CL681_12795 [Blastopirellula sp.]|nr:hypothetical protein [Blastopirellula sp.]
MPSSTPPLLAVMILLATSILRADDPTTLSVERQAQRQARNFFARFDQDENGKLTLQEVAAEHQPLFQRALQLQDQDGDATLSLRQLAEALTRIAQQPQPRPEDNPPRPDDDAAKPREATVSVRVGALFQALDANHDGKISASEIRGASAHLNELDRNDDGQLTIRELLDQTRPVTIQIEPSPATPRPARD